MVPVEARGALPRSLPIQQPDEHVVTRCDQSQQLAALVEAGAGSRYLFG